MSEPRKLLSDPPPYQRLRPNQIDNLGEALLALGRELWVVTDRLTIVEAVLERKGMLIQDEIDAFQPDEGLEQALKAKRDRLLSVIEQALSD